MPLIVNIVSKAIEKLNPVIISGIGCSGRAAGFFNLDSIHTTHGRAIPVAVGVKIANPKLDVIIISGDGDLAGIGGNHLIHAARRNNDITVICNNNEIYGMTGGQLSPTTKKGTYTLTSPNGSDIPPINIQGIITSNEKYFYARTSVTEPEHIKKCIEKALEHKGFSFVEIVSDCITNKARRLGIKSIKEMHEKIKNSYKITKNKTLKRNELGIMEL